VPVVLHDRSLVRVAGVGDAVGSLTAAELAALHLDGTPGVGVPTLAEVLAVLREVPVMVEVKQNGLRAGKLERAVVAVLDAHPGPWCVAGFNPATLRWFRRHRPDAVRVLTATGEPLPRIPGPVQRRLAELRDLPSVAPHAVSYDLTSLPTAATDAWRERRSGAHRRRWRTPAPAS
jgi:hypothetical protein